jgi:hypothetical protein
VIGAGRNTPPWNRWGRLARPHGLVRLGRLASLSAGPGNGATAAPTGNQYLDHTATTNQALADSQLTGSRDAAPLRL